MTDTPSPDAILRHRREFASTVVQRLRAAGYEALWAGGCVRDLLLEREPLDFDVATSAKPQQVRELFGHRRTLAVGASFGVIIVLGPHAAAGQVEVATFRSDAQYSDGRRPDSVRFSTAEEDAQRRDFTINGMFYDPLDQRVIDYVGGRDDLQRGLIRAIGDADARIGEDKLRMLRAVRFAARLGFAIESRTEAALARHANELAIVSGERMAAEMHKTLITAGRETAVRTWAETGLLAVLLPGLARAWSQLGEQACGLLRSVAPDPWTVAVSTLLYPLVDAQTVTAAELCDDLRTRLKLSNEEFMQLGFCLHSQALLDAAPRLAWSQVQPTMAHRYAALACELFAARVACGRADVATLDWLRQRLAWQPDRLDPPVWVTGRDLQQLGFSPGPRFKQLLGEIRALQLDGQLVDRQQALAWLTQQR